MDDDSTARTVSFGTQRTHLVEPGLTTLVVPVNVLDARTLKRLDDHRDPRPARREYDDLFERVDD